MNKTMKTIRQVIAKKELILMLLGSYIFGFLTATTLHAAGFNYLAEVERTEVLTEVTDGKKKIKIALLLDTSGSMDGLINQAKSELWSLVNELSKAECNGEKPELQIALYEYGKSSLPASEGYIRMVTPLTDDLDLLSKDLFSLTINGGDEFCGQVIERALDQLDWSRETSDLQVIFIAGNEPFTQGPVNYVGVCQRAAEKGIIVNTIHCGEHQEGIRTQWKHGADITGGEYMSIDHNMVSREIDTPYDDEIVKLNEDLNKTYISYGVNGARYKQNQEVQDANAYQVDKKVLVKRSVSKSGAYYKKGAEKWDLVSKMEEAAPEAMKEELAEMEVDELPEEIKSMGDAEKVKYVQEKQVERKKIEGEIAALKVKRESYISQNSNSGDEGMLQNAMINAITEQAKMKSIVIK